jgi:restriction system protein
MKSMFNDAAKIMNQAFFYPFVFIVASIFIYIAIGTVIYYKFLYRWIPEIFAKLAGFVGCVLILLACTQNYDKVKGIVANWSLPKIFIGFLIIIVVFAVVVSFIGNQSSGRLSRGRKIKRARSGNSKSTQKRSPSSVIRPDEVILQSHLNELTGFEFERLLALYFRARGYEVKEVGVGGNDGGVDLVIIDQRGEKTAVQAKCYSNKNNVGVQTVRELVAAKRNHDCILSLLVTTSDLTQQARKEAEHFKVDYWHGGMVEQKLASWGKWRPTNKKQRTYSKSQIEIARSQVAVDSSIICKCGANMVKRRSKKDGMHFWGCSTYPKCRHTKSIME